MDYVYVDADHGNSFRIVRSVGYRGLVDLEKYVDLVRATGQGGLMSFEGLVFWGGGGLQSRKLIEWIPGQEGGPRTG